MAKKFISLFTLLVLISAHAAFGSTSTIPSDILKIGKSSAGDKTIELNKGSGSANPKIKWNNSASKLQYSNDGTNFNDIGSGSGGSGQNYISNGDFEAQLLGWSDFNDSFTFATTDVNTTTDIITKTAHGLIDGDKVNFTSSTTLPGGLSAGTVYYVKVASSSTFQVSTTLGGAAVDLTSQGTGTHTLIPLQPIDGTGGTSTASWTASSSSPLSGLYSLLYAHTAANESGQGKSYAFTIDRKDQGKVLQISFDLTLVSGTYSGSTTTDYSDLTIWIYDVTNGVRIQPDRYNVNTGVVGIYPQHLATFQTPINSTSFRFIIQSSKPTATAFSFKMDSLVIGPQSRFQGAPVTGPYTYNPTVTNWLSTGTSTATYYKIANFLQVRGNLAITGGNAGALVLSLPPGLTIDTTQLNNLAIIGKNKLGYGDYFKNAAGQFLPLHVVYNNTTTIKIFAETGSSPTQMTDVATANATAANDSIDYWFEVPIAGWSSSTAMSSDAATRVVTASAHISSAASTTAGNPFNFDTIDYDTHGAITTGATSWKFTAPVSGYYKVSFSLYGGVSAGFFVYKNGSNYRLVGTSNASLAASGVGSTEVQMNAGEFIDVRSNNTQTPTASGITTGTLAIVNWIAIEQTQGPSTIAASESVYALYTVTGSLSFSTTVPWNATVKELDTHNAVQIAASSPTGLWRFNVPLNGTYEMCVNGVSGGDTIMHIYKNGTLFGGTGSLNTAAGGGCRLVRGIPGDYLDVRSPSGGASNTSDSNGRNYISVKRIGN